MTSATNTGTGTAPDATIKNKNSPDVPLTKDNIL